MTRLYRSRISMLRALAGPASWPRPPSSQRDAGGVGPACNETALVCAIYAADAAGAANLVNLTSNANGSNRPSRAAHHHADGRQARITRFRAIGTLAFRIAEVSTPGA